MPKDRREKDMYYLSSLDDIGDIYLSIIILNALILVIVMIGAFMRDGVYDWLWIIVGLLLIYRIISFYFRTTNKR